MIDEQNPNEDDITKIDLLKRMDGFRAIVESFRGQVGDQVEGAKQSMPQELEKKMIENQKIMDQFAKDLDSKLKVFRDSFDASAVERLAALDRRLDEVIGRIEQKFINLHNDVYQKIDDSIASFDIETKNGSANSKKELEVVVNNAISSAVGRVTEMRRYLDGRLANLEDQTLRTAETAVEKHLSELVAASKEAANALEDCRHETSDAMTKFQSETMGKITYMNDLFATITSQFSVIAKTLGTPKQ